MSDYNYKIILKKTDNNIVNTIYEKVKNIYSKDKLWLVNNLKTFVFNHLKLPLYDKKDIEEIVYNYGIQKAIQYYILNKKYYEEIMNLIEHDETNLIYGIAFNIIYEYFEYRIIEN